MKNILAIDDEQPILDVLKDALNAKGYRVFTTNSAEELSQILKENEIHLVLLDVHMPNKDGFSIYKDIGTQRQVPVLFVTGYPKSFNGESREFTELWKNQFILGRTDILYKPFKLDLLYEKVEGLIGDSEAIENESSL